MPKKEITPSTRAKLATGLAINDLAGMVQKGFIGIESKMARKVDMEEGFYVLIMIFLDKILTVGNIVEINKERYAFKKNPC